MARNCLSLAKTFSIRCLAFFVKGARRLAGFPRWDDRRLAGFSERLEHPLVRIERLVGNERLGLKLWEQGIGSSQIVLLTAGEMKADRIAERIDGGVNFRAQPSARAPDGLILTPLFTCSRAVLVGAHDGGVDHRVFVVRVVRQVVKNPLPNPALRPSAEPRMDRFRIAKP